MVSIYIEYIISASIQAFNKNKTKNQPNQSSIIKGIACHTITEPAVVFNGLQVVYVVDKKTKQVFIKRRGTVEVSRTQDK